MNEIEETIKGLEANQEQAIKLLHENVELKNKLEELETRLKKASELVRSRSYTTYTEKTHETKVDITGKKWDELMKYLEDRKC